MSNIVFNPLVSNCDELTPGNWPTALADQADSPSCPHRLSQNLSHYSVKTPQIQAFSRNEC